jgi:hypothetical protein
MFVKCWDVYKLSVKLKKIQKLMMFLVSFDILRAYEYFDVVKQNQWW